MKKRQPSKTPHIMSWPSNLKCHICGEKYLSQRMLDKHYTSEECVPRQNRLWQVILSFIDWLNKLVGAEKSKEKTNSEQMDSLSDLFYEVGTEQYHRPDFTSPIWDEAIDNAIKWRMNQQTNRYFRNLFYDDTTISHLPIQASSERFSFLFGILIRIDNGLETGVVISIGEDGSEYELAVDVEKHYAPQEDVDPGIDWGADEDYTAISIMDKNRTV